MATCFTFDSVVQLSMDMSLPLTPVSFPPSVPKYGTLIPNRIFVGGIANDVRFTQSTYFSVFCMIFRLDALALSVIATATWLGGWVAGCHTPVLYQNR